MKKKKNQVDSGKILEEIEIMADTLKKIMKNEMEFLIRVDTITAKSAYTSHNGREFVSEDDYDRLYDIIIKNHNKFLKILEGLEKLK